MRLKITHRTEYSYDEAVAYALQRYRLTPYTGGTQRVLSWSIAVEGAREQVRFVDQFANETILVSVEGEPHQIAVVASGEVETEDKAGVTGPHRGFAPLWLFRADTPLTARGAGVAALVGSLTETSELARLHELSDAISDAVVYRQGETDVGTDAEAAIAAKAGVCQDHAHVFIACARALGLPARYVSGYLLSGKGASDVASHAWGEAHLQGLGWVGFDPSNRMSPDERYVRLATGRDYRDAMPVSGIRLGAAQERLAVAITVEQ